MKKTREQYITEIKENLYKLNRDKLHYIIYVIEEVKRGNKKYTNNITRQKIWQQFHDWKTRQAVTI